VANKTTSWLPLTLWDECLGELKPSDLVGKRCYAGLDLSSTTDLTAVGLVFPPQDGLDDYYIMAEQWIPQDNMKERSLRDKVPYDKWAREGYINVTPGDVIDYDFIKARLIALNEQYDIVGWGNDPWGAEKLRQDLDREADIELLEVRQNIAHMNGPMKEIERLMKTGNLKHVHDPVTRWAFGNVSIVTDGNENYKPKKTSKITRIDPIIAVINAMYICLKLEDGETKERQVTAI
jgi:phage terminase large subunit-like protein